AAVARVTVQDGAVTGVVLASGDAVPAPLVCSSADPRRTFLELLDPDLLDPEFARAVTHIKFRGAAARLILSLAEPPPFTTLCVAPSLDDVERAADAAKYGRVSERPWLEARAAGVDAAGRHRVGVHVQYAPYELQDGEWDAARRDALGDVAVGLLAEHVPGFGATVLAREVLTPRDLEARYGAAEGNLDHGELTLDQILFMRPVPGWAHYRTPVRGLYLCGAGAHPGGGIAGGAGLLAARAVVRDRR
ncbi:MAG: phytoene desaturase family protein, partial [Gemmatimonadales bacterium]